MGAAVWRNCFSRQLFQTLRPPGKEKVHPVAGLRCFIFMKLPGVVMVAVEKGDPRTLCYPKSDSIARYSFRTQMFRKRTGQP